MSVSTSPTPPRSGPAPEFVGLARAFVQRVNADGAVIGIQMRKISADAFTLLKRKKSKGYSADNLLAIETAWRRVPLTGCVSLEITRTNKRLSIVHVRASQLVLANARWDNYREPAICLVSNRITLAKMHAYSEAVTIASISLHALLRFFQRGFDTSDAGLMLALLTIANAAEPLIADKPAVVTIETGNGGAWRGHLADLADDHGAVRPAVNIRTFW